MKKFRFLTMAAAALMLSACSDSVIDGGSGQSVINPATEDGVFFSINIELPSAKGTRGQTTDPENGYSTSTNGVEIGQDYENYVGEVIVVLAESSDNQTDNNKFIAAATVPKKDIKSLASDSYTVLSKFSKTQLAAFYNTNPDNFSCNIYVFANPTSGIKAIIFGVEDDDAVTGAELGTNAWINEIRTLSGVPTTNIANKEGNEKKGSFLMSNALVAVREIPTNLDDWRYYTTDGNPFDLSGPNADVFIDNGTLDKGSVKLERVAARFDFRDASPLDDYKYHVVYSGTTDDAPEDRTPIIDIQLINMSLVNVNKSYYPIRRVSPTGAPTDITICGPERRWIETSDGGYTGGNYIVDPAYQAKNQIAALFAGGAIPTGPIAYATYFFYPFLSEYDQITDVQRTKWFTETIPNVLKGTEDNNVSWNEDNTKGDYHIWTYATENIISDIKEQINGITTGVVFKGKMVATEEALNSDDDDVRDLANAINNVGGVLNNQSTAPVIYQFGGNLYLGWNNLRNAALSAALSKIQWVPDNEEKPYESGHWDFEAINRSTSLYVAVFGTGGFGRVNFKYTVYDYETGDPVLDENGKPLKLEGYIDDNLPMDTGCADYLYQAWQTTPNATTLANYKKATTDAKITIYESFRDNNAYGGTGYFVYYYYWNRHNDNLNNGVMGPMEFAVVRNNVYKLAVTDIKKLGHPRLTENDPERPIGGTPDEKEDVYITVTAEVLPWVVRVNNIVF